VPAKKIVQQAVKVIPDGSKVTAQADSFIARAKIAHHRRLNRQTKSTANIPNFGVEFDGLGFFDVNTRSTVCSNFFIDVAQNSANRTGRRMPLRNSSGMFNLSPGALVFQQFTRRFDPFQLHFPTSRRHL